MTYSKLALRNARRQARDYLVYFVTVVMAAALLYSFNGLVFSQEVRGLSENMSNLPLVIVAASIVVVCIFGWLVSYATGFMLSRRSRELGTYVLIGLTNRQVARLFFLENLVVGGTALVMGLILGGLLYQVLRAVLFAMFGLPYHFVLSLSLSAVGLTLFYFVLIYLHALWKSRKRISSMKIYDLIYLDRQNEGAVIQTGKIRSWTFSVSIVLGIAGTVLLMTMSLLAGLTGAGCMIVALFGFFQSFASGVPAFFEKRPAQKYQGQNLLVFRTLTAKLATMGIVMAVISMVFAATVMTEGSGLVLNGLVRGRAAENACFDLLIGIEDQQQDLGRYLDYIEKNIPVEQSVSYPVYLRGNAQVMDYISSKITYYNYDCNEDAILRYSDYAALRSVAGYPAVELGPGQYLIHCITYLEDVLRAYDQPLVLDGTALAPGGIYTEHLTQTYGNTNGCGFILVVPDEMVEGLISHHWVYAARMLQPVSRTQYYDLWEINFDETLDNPMSSDAIYARANEESEVAELTAVFVFPLFYLALALMMTAAAILTIQQLSETERYRRQFMLLRKLGMDRQEMSKALSRQFAIYYAMPAVPPVLVGVPFILHFAKMPEPGVMVGLSSPGNIAVISLGIFFLIYAVYILLAYISLKRNVLPE